jgi:hypothetical protein
MIMNRRLEEAIAPVEALPDDRQSEAAEVLFAFLDAQAGDIQLTPEQIAEIERRMSDKEPFATDEEVRSTFARLTGEASFQETCACGHRSNS